MFFSIIIPVYNVEKYLKFCINSILQQNFNNYEIILVDDGSTDSSSIICDEYSKYKNIKVFHKKNGGLSSARNTGLEKAIGEYIVFLDSDDYFISDSVLDKLFLVINKYQCDLFYSGNVYYDTEGQITYNKYNFIISKSRRYFFEINEVYGKKFQLGAPFFIYKREFLKNNNLTFTENLLHEDIDWIQRVIIKTCSIGYLKFGYYCYRLQRKNSITNSMGKRNYEALQSISDRCFLESVQLKGFDKLFSRAYSAQIISQILSNKNFINLIIKEKNYYDKFNSSLSRLLYSFKITHLIKFIFYKTYLAINKKK